MSPGPLLSGEQTQLSGVLPAALWEAQFCGYAHFPESGSWGLGRGRPVHPGPPPGPDGVGEVPMRAGGGGQGREVPCQALAAVCVWRWPPRRNLAAVGSRWKNKSAGHRARPGLGFTRQAVSLPDPGRGHPAGPPSPLLRGAVTLSLPNPTARTPPWGVRPRGPTPAGVPWWTCTPPARGGSPLAGVLCWPGLLPPRPSPPGPRLPPGLQDAPL